MRRARRIVLGVVASVLVWFIYRARSLEEYVGGGSVSSATSSSTSTEWTRAIIRQDANNFKSPLRSLMNANGGAQFEPQAPLLGKHDKDANAILVFAVGYPPQPILRFVESLRKTGCDADIVLGVDYEGLMASLKEREGEAAAGAFRGYLENASANDRLVLYDVNLDCEGSVDAGVCTWAHMYKINKGGNEPEYLLDPRSARSVKFLRYEYYWAWSTRYLGGQNNQIFVSDLRDVYFQADLFLSQPFSSETMNAAFSNCSDGNVELHQTTLKVFVEDSSKFNIGSQRSNELWIRQIGGDDVLEKIGHNPIVCSGTTIGGAIAMESYLRAMIQEYDENECTINGCDQGYHNYLLYTEKLFGGSEELELETTILTDENTKKVAAKVVAPVKLIGDPTSRRINRIEYFSFGYGPVNTVGLFCGFGGQLRQTGLMVREDETDESAVPVVLNWDGMVTPVLHQIDRCNEIFSQLEAYADLLWKLVKEGLRRVEII